MITTIHRRDQLLARIGSLEQQLDAEPSSGMSEDQVEAQRAQALLEIAEIKEQIVWYEAASERGQLKVQPEGLVVTPVHVRAGLTWFFGKFSSEINMSSDEAATLLNANAKDVAHFGSNYKSG